MPLEPEFERLGSRVLDVLRAHPEEFGAPRPLESLSPPPVVPGLPEFVLESEAGLLLGEPPARSLSLAVPVPRLGDGGSMAWVFGPSPSEAAVQGRTHHFLQLILVETPEPLSRPLLSRVSSLRSLAAQLPGYLAHSVGAETTARVHRKLVAAGLTQGHLAHTHGIQARARGFGGKVCVAVGLPTARGLELLAQMADELKRLTASLAAVGAARPGAGAGAVGGSGGDGRNPDGQAPEGGNEGAVTGCEGKTCATCDDKDVCDKVRAVLAAHANAKQRGTK